MKTHEANSFMSRSIGKCIFLTVAPVSMPLASVCL